MRVFHKWSIITAAIVAGAVAMLLWGAPQFFQRATCEAVFESQGTARLVVRFKVLGVQARLSEVLVFADATGREVFQKRFRVEDRAGEFIVDLAESRGEDGNTESNALKASPLRFTFSGSCLTGRAFFLDAAIWQTTYLVDVENGAAVISKTIELY